MPATDRPVTEDEAMRAAAKIYAEAKIRIATEQAIREAQRGASDGHLAVAS